VSKNRAWLNPKIAIAAAVLALAVGYLMYTSVQSTSASYFVTVSELRAQADSVDGDLVRVGGDVVEGSIEIDGVAGPMYFEISDGNETLAVVYDRQVPDIFGEHIEAVVEGTFRKNGVFEAETILTKCPSRFDADDGSYEDYHGDEDYTYDSDD
jgi:cytochrome c-type biogenesis protein CcmE